MHFTQYLILTLASVFAAIATPLDERQTAPLGTLPDTTVYQPGSGYDGPGVLYGRSVQLPDSSLLATWENYSPEPPLVYFPIYRSTDYGKTWAEISRVADTHRSLGARFQPNLYVLPASLGQYPAGTLILVANILPKDGYETHIDMYTSLDNGQTWAFASNIASGGRASIENGQTPVWEPFALMHDGQLAVYYADSRDPAHGQKTVHQVTTDGLNWNGVVNDAAHPVYAERPGMPVVAQLHDGRWMLTYEFVNAPEGNAPVYYKIAPDPWSFGEQTAIPLIASNGARPQSSPYVVVTDGGRIIVSGGQSGDLFINDSNGDQNAWRSVASGLPNAYSRCLNLISEPNNSKQWLMVTGAGFLSNQPTNRVSVGVLDPDVF